MNYNAGMMWWPLFFISLLVADEDLTVEKYCFNSPPHMEEAYLKFKSISVPVDRVEKENNCLVISTRPHRRELIQKYLLSGYPEMNISFSSMEMRKEPCDIKVEKFKTTSVNSKDIELSRQYGASANELNKSASETFHITTLKEFELSVDQDKIQGECKYISPQRYEITLLVLKELRPVIPNTIPVAAPSDQETSSLKTQIQLQRGSRIEIGSVMRNLKGQRNAADSDPKLVIESNDRKSEEKVFLSIH